MGFKKGKSGNASTQFSKDRQPASNGRPKKLVNVIKKLPDNMMEEVYGILAYALTLPSEEDAKVYLTAKGEELGRYGFVMQIAIRQLANKNYGWGAVNDILDRLYGKPRMSAEVKHTGDNLTIVVNTPEEKELISNMNDLTI